MSPFNAQCKRHTAFAALQVVPMLHDGDVDVEVDESDIKTDVFRASGAGGQHLNKPSSAVRLTPLPSGLIASCQMERPALQIRAKAIGDVRQRAVKGKGVEGSVDAGGQRNA